MEPKEELKTYERPASVEEAETKSKAEFLPELLKVFDTAKMDEFEPVEPAAGAELAMLDDYDASFSTLVNEMFEKMATETKILEGSVEIEYEAELPTLVFTDSPSK
uniref:Uncharacterized protein n=1 Tax=viral metagenome TaxID=1070528 RepID=A0A6C0J2N1_9ZZZZ